METINQVHSTGQSKGHPSFLFIYSFRIPVELRKECESSWQSIDCGRAGFLCINTTEPVSSLFDDDQSITLGVRHENGDGVFCRITMPPDRQFIRFETDSMPGIPIFWMVLSDYVLVSSDLSTLIRACNDLSITVSPDLQSAAEIMVASYIFSQDQRTPIRNVRVLPARSAFTVYLHDGQTEVTALGERFAYTDRVMEWPECVDQLKKGLQDGFRRHIGKKVAVLLSGGADSRIAAATAISVGLEPDFFTFGQSTVNASDFAVANAVAYAWDKSTRCFSANADSFRDNWKSIAERSNWSSDCVWWAGKLPKELFDELQGYDVVIRGDGDGSYGWKGAAGNISDILHIVEITPGHVANRYSKFFLHPEDILGIADEARLKLIEEFSAITSNLTDLKNMAYSWIREQRGIAPGAWVFSKVTNIDAPLLWSKPLRVAKQLPRKRRTNKQAIFAVLKTYPEIMNVPFSDSGSWNDRLEFYQSGMWEELLDYVHRWTSWDLNMPALKDEFLKPPDVPQPHTMGSRFRSSMKGYVGNHRYIRSVVQDRFPRFVGTSMQNRILIRIALASSLMEKIASPTEPLITRRPGTIKN